MKMNGNIEENITFAKATLFATYTNPKSKHGCNQSQMNDQYCLLPCGPIIPFLILVEWVKCKCNTQGCSRLHVIFGEQGLVYSQKQKSNVEVLIKRSFHTCLLDFTLSKKKKLFAIPAFYNSRFNFRVI